MLAFGVQSQLMRADLHKRHRGWFVIGPLSHPEVLIRCRDLLACVQTLALIKKPNTPDTPVNVVRAVHPRSTRAKLMF